MSNFNEANTVEAYILDILCGGITKHTASEPGPKVILTAPLACHAVGSAKEGGRGNWENLRKY